MLPDHNLMVRNKRAARFICAFTLMEVRTEAHAPSGCKFISTCQNGMLVANIIVVGFINKFDQIERE